VLHILRVAVVENDILEELIKNEDCTSINDLAFDIPRGYDYAQTALVDEYEKHVLFWGDNIHENPDDYIDGFIHALNYTNENYTIKNIVMLYDDLKNYSGKKYR
jgi:hypothetical protein